MCCCCYHQCRDILDWVVYKCLYSLGNRDELSSVLAYHARRKATDGNHCNRLEDIFQIPLIHIYRTINKTNVS